MRIVILKEEYTKDENEAISELVNKKKENKKHNRVRAIGGEGQADQGNHKKLRLKPLGRQDDQNLGRKGKR